MSKKKKRLDYFSPIGDYELYDDGRVYSKKTKKWLKPEITIYGYKQYTLFIDGKTVRKRAHRLVAEEFIPNPNHLPVVNHKNGKKLICTTENLEWCTVSDNNKHARMTGLNNVSKSNHDRWQDSEFREKTKKHFSEIHKALGDNIGEKNPRFRYRIFYKDTVITRKELAKLISRSQSNTDAIIKKAADGEYVKVLAEYGITVVKVK